jgi:hypothetical protein
MELSRNTEYTLSIRSFERLSLLLSIFLNFLYVNEVYWRPNPNGKSVITKSSVDVASKIDFHHCRAKTTISTRVSSSLKAGLGHRLTQTFFVFRFAVLHGYCFCFDVHSLGSDKAIYELILEPLFPSCTRYEIQPIIMSFQDFEDLLRQNKILQNTLYELTLTDDIVWPEIGDLATTNHEGALSFADSFIQQNCLLQQLILPWYKSRRVMNVKKCCNSTDARAVYVVFHIRVGDIVLETSLKYWENLISTIRMIVDHELGQDVSINAFFSYFQSNHKLKKGRKMRKHLESIEEQWSNSVSLLPPSHKFIYQICQEKKSLKCFWKSGCQLIESIDMYMMFDYVYLSGSAFSRSLAIFSSGTKLVAKPKEIVDNMSSFVLQHNALSNTAYYHINSNGCVYDEQLAFLSIDIK